MNSAEGYRFHSPGSTEPVGALGMVEDEIRNHDISSIPCPSRGEKEMVDLQCPRWCVKKSPWLSVTESGPDTPSGTSVLIAARCGPLAIRASPRLSAPN